jgi:hypothetical protein
LNDTNCPIVSYEIKADDSGAELDEGLQSNFWIDDSSINFNTDVDFEEVGIDFDSSYSF